VGDAAEDSTILATSGVKNTPKNSSLGGEGHIEKASSTSADCRIPTTSSTSHEGDSGEVWFSLADSTILTASEVKEFPSNLTVVIPEGVEGDAKQASATSADCCIPTVSSTSHAEDMGEVCVSSADSTILATSEVK
jgi:hypothetical protein